MNTIPHPTSDLEALSALFDGELGGDPARFALKRLDHDQAWRSTCERWSLVGDVLRGQGHALLPAGFPARVRAAAIAPAPAPALARTGRWAAWGGAGLAASVAAVALFFARQAGDVEAPVQAAPLVANATPVPAPPAAADPAAAPRPDGRGAVQLASAGLAVAGVSRQGSQRARAAQRGRAAASAPVRGSMPAVAPAPRVAVAAAPLAPEAASAPTPFAGDASARPWPRAVLPQLGGSGGLVTGFGSASPSFYPFEPRLPGEAEDDRSEADPAAP